MRRALAACLLAACNGEAIVIVPVIDSPEDADSSVLADLTSIRLTVEDSLGIDVAPPREFARGSTIEVGGIEFADSLSVQIDGFNGLAPIGVGRTCPFNVQPGDPASPHIFLSRLGKSADLAFSATQRNAGSAVTTPDQRVLLIGGNNPLIERFDPITNTFSEVGEVAARTGGVLALIGETAPRPAVFGGFAAATIDVVGYDGRVDQFPDDGRVLARPQVAAARLPAGDVLVTGGRNLDDTASNAVAVVVLDESLNEARIEPVANLARAREGHAMTALGEGQGAKVLITGGSSSGVAITESEIFDPITRTFVGNLDARFDLISARSDHRALALADGSILVIGGVDGANGVTTVEQFSPITGFMQSATMPPGAPVIDFTLLSLPDGRAMIVGGRSAPNAEPLRSIYLINFSEGQVSINSAADTLTVGRVNPQVAVLCDGTVLISGGTNDAAVIERFNANQPKLPD